MHTNGEELKKLVVERLNQLGSLECTKKVLVELESKLCAELKRTGADPDFIAIFNQHFVEP